MTGGYGIVDAYLRDSRLLGDAREALQSRGLLSAADTRQLATPGVTNKFRLSTIINALVRQASVLADGRLELPRAEPLVQMVRSELRLLSLLSDAKTVDQLLETTSLRVGRVREIEEFESALNYPRILRADEVLFLRYTGVFGRQYVGRARPQQVVYLSLQGESFFRELLGDDEVVRTLYPSLEAADQARSADDPGTELALLRQRVIIQPCYTPEYGLLDEQTPSEIGRVFGRLIGRIHAGTSTLHVRPSPLTRRSLPETRDKTIEEYIGWLGERCWVLRRLTALSHQGDWVDALFRGRNRVTWSDYVARSAGYWKEGAILTCPDLRPKNTFYRRGQTRIFDFDYLAFLDPAYHLGETMYFALRDQIKNDQAVPEALSSMLAQLIECYHAELPDRLPTFFRTRAYRETALQYFRLMTLTRYVSDCVSGQTSEETVDLAHTVIDELERHTT